MTTCIMFAVGNKVFAGRSPTYIHLYSKKGDKQHYAEVLKVIPARNRVKTKCLLKFYEPDSRTKENDVIEIPHSNKHELPIVFVSPPIIIVTTVSVVQTHLYLLFQ